MARVDPIGSTNQTTRSSQARIVRFILPTFRLALETFTGCRLSEHLATRPNSGSDEVPNAAPRYVPLDLQAAPGRPPALSGRLTMVVVQHSAQLLAALDRSSAITARFFRDDQPIAEASVIPLVMVVRHKFLNGFSQRTFAEQNYSFQARLLNGSDKALGVAIQIGCAGRRLDGLHSGGLQGLQELGCEQRIPGVEQVPLAGQEAFGRVTEIPCDLAHPKPIRLQSYARYLDLPTSHIDEEELHEPGQTLARPGHDREETSCNHQIPIAG